MNVEFINKKTKRHVKYLGPISYVTDGNAEHPEWDYFPRYTWCAQIYDIEGGSAYIIPLLEFMNNYEPATNPIDDPIVTLNNIFKAEDENYKENICTLHSWATNPDCRRDTKVLENRK